MTAFDPQQGSKLFLFVGALDVVRAEGHHHAIRMPSSLLIDGVNQIERVPGKVSLIGFRFHPDGKELGAEVTGLCLVEADVTMIFWIGRPDVVAFVKETLRG